MEVDVPWETLNDLAWPRLERVLRATLGMGASYFMAQISSSLVSASWAAYYASVAFSGSLGTGGTMGPYMWL